MSEFIPLLIVLGYGYALYRWALADEHRKVAKKVGHAQSAKAVANQFGLFPPGLAEPLPPALDEAAREHTGTAAAMAAGVR